MSKLQTTLVLCTTILLMSTANAQRRRSQTPPPAPVATDSTKSEKPKPKKNEPKPYDQVVTSKAVSQPGLVTVHKVEDKYYFELGDSVLNHDILVVSRLSKSAADLRASFLGYAGDQINSSTIRFEKGPNDKIFLRKISYSEFSKDSTMPMYRAVMNSNLQPIVEAFPVAAYNKEKNTSVIDVTDFIEKDNDVLFFNPRFKSILRLGQQQADKSYIESVRTFPINTEIKTVKTYAITSPPGAGGMGSRGGSEGNATVEINSSMVLLPLNPMKPRLFDARVGFFTVGYTDFDADPQGVEKVTMVKRWRLEPKDEDIEKYKRGELVEPKKPIVFYIDPATPAKWIPYLIDGVNDWQKAFEFAGFKNAIIAKRAPSPQEDPEWSLEDARYSAIVYKPSDIPNASGPSIADPRTGEIMESHINWYHNVMSLLRDWYFVQTAAVDSNARKMEFDDELMGQLIRFVSSHEVGHTLGLRHMGLFPRIGDYDDWAIKWGYTWMPQYATAKAEVAPLNKMTIEALKNKRLWFGTESNPDDPRSQNEDLGDDAMKAGRYGIKNLQRILAKLENWTSEPDKDYSNLTNMYGQIRTQYMRYLGHVAKNVAGVYETPKTVEEAGVIYENVPAAKQRAAMQFLSAEVFKTPGWLLDKDILDKIGLQATDVVLGAQQMVLSRLLRDNNFDKLINAEALDGKAAYGITDFFSDLKSAVWTELPNRLPVSVYRRNLQKAYVEKLTDLLKPAPEPAAGSAIVIRFGPSNDLSRTSDAVSVIRAQLIQLRSEMKAAIPAVSDSMTKYHLQDLVSRIDQSLDPK